MKPKKGFKEVMSIASKRAFRGGAAGFAAGVVQVRCEGAAGAAWKREALKRRPSIKTKRWRHSGFVGGTIGAPPSCFESSRAKQSPTQCPLCIITRAHRKGKGGGRQGKDGKHLARFRSSRRVSTLVIFCSLSNNVKLHNWLAPSPSLPLTH